MINYPSITEANSKYSFQDKFNLKPENAIKNIPSNKTSIEEIALHIPKQSVLLAIC